MRKYAWLIALTIPPWAASELGAPKWGIMLALIPFLLFAMTLDDPDEDMFGEATPSVGKGARVFLVVASLVVGGAILILWLVLFPHA